MRAFPTFLVTAAAMAVSLQSNAASLHLCPGRAAPVVDEQASKAGCDSIALGVPASALPSVRVISATKAAELGRDITLTGRPGDTADLAGELTGSAAAPLPTAAPAPAPPTSAPQAQRELPARAAWAWQDSAWRNDAQHLFARAAAYGVKVLFITVPTREDKVLHGAELARFIALARRRDVTVWAVAGDPAMVRPDQHHATITRMRAYAAYNAGVPREARLAGVQFDIEPYLLPDYEQASADWDLRYVQLTRALRKAAPQLPLEMVVPFWWSGKPAMLDALAPHVDALCVMDYRTDPAQVIALAQPLLHWGAVHRKQVRLALEAGQVAPQSQWRFSRADQGQLWHVAVAGAQVLLLLDAARPNPAGSSFALQYRRELDGSATSFYANLSALAKAIPEVEAAVLPWTSFAGMAIHGLFDAR